VAASIFGYVIGCLKGIVSRQHRRAIAAAEMNGAAVAFQDIPLLSSALTVTVCCAPAVTTPAG